MPGRDQTTSCRRPLLLRTRHQRRHRRRTLGYLERPVRRKHLLAAQRTTSAPASQMLRSVWWWPPPRSEEHTSELQSRGHLVCRLLLEKKTTETITSIILIKLSRVSLGTVRHPRRLKIVVIDIQITLKQMLRDFIGSRVNRAK